MAENEAVVDDGPLTFSAIDDGWGDITDWETTDPSAGDAHDGPRLPGGVDDLGPVEDQPAEPPVPSAIGLSAAVDDDERERLAAVEAETPVDDDDDVVLESPFRRGARLVLQVERWTLVIVLWFATLGVVLAGMGKFARIFTGDETWGALDGFEFVDALYGAVVRFLLAILLGYLVWRLMRWRPLHNWQSEEDDLDDDEPVEDDELIDEDAAEADEEPVGPPSPDS